MYPLKNRLVRPLYAEESKNHFCFPERTTVLKNMARQFVLVPGAWLGGWCWKYLTPLLRDEGHDVYAPTLTGLGEREHLMRPEIDLETHITDIVNVLEYNDLTDAVLLGHS